MVRLKDRLSELAGLLLVGAVLVAVGGVASIFILGAAWASAKLLPLFSTLTWLAFGAVVFIVLPLAIPKPTRAFSAVALFVASYVFGATLWMEGLILTLATWGLGAAILGLLLLGGGVVPIAMLATLLKGMWGFFVELVLLTIMTFGCRFGAISLAGSLESS